MPSAAPFSAEPLSCDRPLYRVRGARGLSPIRKLLLATTLVIIGVSTGGCSFRLGNMFAKNEKSNKKEDLSDVTGSISPVVRIKDDTDLTEADLALARNAASDVLTNGAKNASQPWENPETGARGSVTPLASTYTNEGRTCRDFLASYVRGSNEGWLQGEACQDRRGQAWEIRNMKPWKRS